MRKTLKRAECETWHQQNRTKQMIHSSNKRSSSFNAILLFSFNTRLPVSLYQNKTMDGNIFCPISMFMAIDKFIRQIILFIILIFLCASCITFFWYKNSYFSMWLFQELNSLWNQWKFLAFQCSRTADAGLAAISALMLLRQVSSNGQRAFSQNMYDIFVLIKDLSVIFC